MSSVQTRHKRLQCGLAFHAYAYYILDKPLVADAKYDQWYRELEGLEAQYPCLKTRHSPTQLVDRAICDQHLKVCTRCSIGLWERVHRDWT